MWTTAKEYVRLAKSSDRGEEVFPPYRPSDADPSLCARVGVERDFGPWILLALVLAALVSWQQQRWLRPIVDGSYRPIVGTSCSRDGLRLWR